MIELVLALACLLVIGAINEQLHEGRRPARGAPRVVAVAQEPQPVEPEPVEPEVSEPSNLPARTLDAYRTGWAAP